MTVTLPIPDELAARLGEAGDVSRRALEAFGLTEYQAGRLIRPELRRLLGYGTRAEFAGFLKARGLIARMTIAEFEREHQDLDRIGL
jgi:hypothetical protein